MLNGTALCCVSANNFCVSAELIICSMSVTIIYFIAVEKFRVNVQLCTDKNRAKGMAQGAVGSQDLGFNTLI